MEIMNESNNSTLHYRGNKTYLSNYVIKSISCIKPYSRVQTICSSISNVYNTMSIFVLFCFNVELIKTA